MVLADSNFWVALTIPKHEFHAAAEAWFARLKAPEVVAFCRSTQQSFLRLLTTSSLFAPLGNLPLSNKAAWTVYEGYHTDMRISWLNEPRGLETQWQKLSAGPRPSPKLWMDAYLAAFAIAGGYPFVTTDQAFRQFKGLDLVILSND